MSKRVIGVIVDSFDPVLSVHISAARHALEEGRVSLVCFCLAGASGFSSYEDRRRMLVAACSEDRRFLPVFPGPAAVAPGGSVDLPSLLNEELGDARIVPLETRNPSAGPVSVQTEVSSASPSGLLNHAVREYISCLGLYGCESPVPGAPCWIPKLFDALKPRRFAHSLAVAGEAKKLARIHGLDILRAEQAGLLHDCAKSVPLSDMQALAREHGLTEDPGFLASTALLHSLVGAYLARAEYGMEDPEVLDAVRYHNTGMAGMSRLAMCVCLADSIEPLRDPYPFLAEARALSIVSLEKALLLSLERTSEYVRSQGKALHPRTLSAISWLKSLPACSQD